MATSVRTVLKFLIGLFAALPAAPGATEAARPEGPARSETSTMSTFIALLRQDAQLRARFAQDPRAVLRAHRIDPAPFELPERLNDAQFARLLADWSRWIAPAQRLAEGPSPEQKDKPPAPVYGPAPGFQRQQLPPTPAPVVYGPPPGLRSQELPPGHVGPPSPPSEQPTPLPPAPVGPQRP
jgi:hypothetical protein